MLNDAAVRERVRRRAIFDERGMDIRKAGSHVKAWLDGGETDLLTAVWQDSQVRDCLRLVRQNGWTYQPDGSCIPPVSAHPSHRRRHPHFYMHGCGDGIPNTYPLALNGCGSGLPSEYCEGATGSSGALGAFASDSYVPTLIGVGAIAGYFFGGKKLSSAAFGAAGSALLLGLMFKPKG